MAGRERRRQGQVAARFARQERFRPKLAKAKGILESFSPLVRLMAGIASGKDVRDILEEVDAAFAQRNADPEFEGDHFNGGQPARWDLKKEAILAYAGGKYGLDL